jgi:rod shape-determining protein MreD
VTSEASAVRKALTAVVLAAALFATVVIQLTVVNRLPLPGATEPDLVLLLVTAIAVATGPLAGALVGFAGGLALDVAPPAVHYAGEYALVFCLAGYAAARVARAIRDVTGERDPVTDFTVMAIAAAAGEAGKAALGMLLSDPDVTGAAVRSLLPGAILYDLLLAPVVFWLVARVTRGTASWSTAPERAPVPEFSRAQRLAPVFRQASAGAAPHLRFAGTGANYGNSSPARRVPKLRLSGTGVDYGNSSPARRVPHLRLSGTGANYGNSSPARRVPHLRLSGTGANYRSPSLARRVPKLRLSGARSASSRAAGSASPGGAPLALAGGRTPKLNFAGNPPARTAKRVVRAPGKNWLRAAGSSARRPPASGASPRPASFAGSSTLLGSSARLAARRTSRSPSRGWLRSAGAGRRAGGLAGLARTARAAGSPIAARSARSAAEALAARSAPSGVSALSGAGTPLARRRSPRSGWLRAASPSRAAAGQPLSPRRGWLGGAGRPRAVIGSTVAGRTVIGSSGSGHRGTFRPSRASRRGGTVRGNWYTASPSGAWLRRGRHPWRKRSYLPGGRPPVPPGARAMAKTAIVSRARKPRLFGLLGGRR